MYRASATRPLPETEADTDAHARNAAPYGLDRYGRVLNEPRDRDVRLGGRRHRYGDRRRCRTSLRVNDLAAFFLYATVPSWEGRPLRR